MNTPPRRSGRPATWSQLGYGAPLLATLSLLWLGCAPEPGYAGCESRAVAGTGGLATMPGFANDYAQLCEPHVGVPPTIDCGDGVPIPVHVDGIEVAVDQAPRSCDVPGFDGGCYVGSRVGRSEGRYSDGEAMTEVVWGWICRSAGAKALDRATVQMIGHNTQTGATCFFEAAPNQEAFIRFDASGKLVGQMPAAGTLEFDAAFIPPPIECTDCHESDPFIHGPWVDAARRPEDPSQPVIPQVAAPQSPYWVVGGADWDLRTVHIEGNACLSCHRAPTEIARLFELGDNHVDSFMPPHQPGSMQDDYAALARCAAQGPTATPGCEWVSPPRLCVE